jgi:glycerate 2-kinase
MPLKILIVPDKFKGTLTAQVAADLIAQGWREIRPDDVLELLPMSDGGDGFGEVMAQLFNAQPQYLPTVNAAHEPHTSTWWWHQPTRTAIIESAQVIGLALLPPGKHHPFELDTFGLGAVLRAAAARNSDRFVVGIGGSATNDGGFGMARSLGWTFLNAEGSPIERWADLRSLRSLRPPSDTIPAHELLVAVDVQNPLLGPAGASQTYGPQKGLRPEDFALAEACLAQLTEVVKEELGLDVASEPGTGAAGGLGFGLRAFLGARLESGFELFSRSARLDERIRGSDMVITGEGAIDRSTLMGKGVGEVAGLCARHRVPCLGLAGKLALDPSSPEQAHCFTRISGIAPLLTSEKEAREAPQLWLPRLAAAIAQLETSRR